MKILKIRGGNPLVGEVCIGGAKNSSMPVVIASILSKKESIIHNIPHVADLTNLLKILMDVGSSITVDGNHTENPSKAIKIKTEILSSQVVDSNITSQIRTSILLLGPILARNGYVKLTKPGGCDIGERKIDLHLMAMKKLGAVVTETPEFVEATTNGKRLVGTTIVFPIISVGATENAIMASTLAQGTTILQNIAIEPEIDDLINFLNQSGAKITKTGERELTIIGVEELDSANYYIMPDRIEAITYAMLAAITNGEIKMHHCDFTIFGHLINIFKDLGIEIENFISEDGIKGIVAKRMPAGLKPIHVETNPYPLFPTDAQPQLMSLLALTSGTSSIVENIFENRLQHAVELKKLGAKVDIHGRKATITGVEKFSGGVVKSSDLRAGAALVMAACACSEDVIIEQAEFIDRGYQTIVKNLTRLGCDIKAIYNWNIFL